MSTTVKPATINIIMNVVKKRAIYRRNVRCAILYLLTGLLCALLGILSIIYDFQDLALNERIKVRPGLPAYELWRNPNRLGVDIGFKLHLFAVENPYEFLSNKTAKLKLKDIGPIIYKKILHQKDIVFHEENSTMSFSSVYSIEFDKERNKPGILNQTITLVNPMLLAFAVMASDMFLARIAFNMISSDDKVFLNRTVYQALWNNTSPIFEFVKKIPFASPRHNAGIMFNSFYPSENRYNVNIGPKHGYDGFFKINTFNGLPRIADYVERYPKYCPVWLKGASEGTGLSPHIGKEDVIYAYTKNLCRTYPMVYNSTVDVNGMESYKYVLSEEIYKRLEDPNLDCFKKSGDIMLPDGLSDSSKCAFGLPVAVSNPHFYGYHGEWQNYLEGIKPNADLHSSYIIVEPKSGVQLEGMARLQSNLPLPNMENFSPSIQRFSNMILPQFWMEYFMINNDPVILAMVRVFLNLPTIQVVFVVLILFISVWSFYKSVRLMKCACVIELIPEEQKTVYEQEPFCEAK